MKLITANQQKNKQDRQNGKPRRPLTAYNIFFRYERKKIIAEQRSEQHQKHQQNQQQQQHGTVVVAAQVVKEETKAAAAKSHTTNEAANNDTNNNDNAEEEETHYRKLIRKKRSGKHAHVGFQTLARLISDRWKHVNIEYQLQLDKEAKKDREQFDFKMKEWEESMLDKKSRDKRAKHDEHHYQQEQQQHYARPPQDDEQEEAAPRDGGNKEKREARLQLLKLPKVQSSRKDDNTPQHIEQVFPPTTTATATTTMTMHNLCQTTQTFLPAAPIIAQKMPTFIPILPRRLPNNNISNPPTLSTTVPHNYNNHPIPMSTMAAFLQMDLETTMMPSSRHYYPQVNPGKTMQRMTQRMQIPSYYPPSFSFAPFAPPLTRVTDITGTVNRNDINRNVRNILRTSPIIGDGMVDDNIGVPIDDPMVDINPIVADRMVDSNSTNDDTHYHL